MNTDLPQDVSDRIEADDPRLVSALEEFLTALEAGQAPDRAAFLARHPDLRDEFADCLAGLEIMHGARSRPPSAADSSGHAAQALAEPLHLGDFRIIRQVGRGGMGVVYEAEQASLGRRVALKVLPLVAGLDERQLQRFQHEAQAAAHLEHRGIVPVYAVGCDGGVHYYAMQFIDGRSLADVLAALRGPAPPPADTDGANPEPASPAPSSTEAIEVGDGSSDALSQSNEPPHAGRCDHGSGLPRTIARLGIEAAEALEYAHQVGVVHRDIKPANLLLDRWGHLWITDFGLAQIRGQSALTLTGDLLGTLRYMSPEQARARRGLVDHRTDVYSLGATLYELLTLQSVVAGNDREELLRQIAGDDPVSPRRLNKALPPELEVIVSKALAKAPEERYGTAQELADDLHRFLDDRPILARPPSLLHRGRKFLRRHRTLLGALAISVALLAIGSLLATLSFALERNKFAQDRILAQQEAEDKLYKALMGRSYALRQARVPGYRQGVWDVLDQATRLDVAARDLEAIEAEAIACLGDPLSVEPATPGSVTRPQGRPVPPEFAAVIRETRPYGFRHAVRGDGQMLAMSCGLGKISLWPREGTEPLAMVDSIFGGLYDLDFTADGQLLVAGCEEGFAIWTVPGLQLQTRSRGGNTHAVAAHPSGRWLATAGRRIELWSLVSNRLVADFESPNQGATVEFSADGRHLLAVVSGKVARAWNILGTPEKQVLLGHRAGVPSVAFSSDGRHLASVSKDFSVRIWDAETGTLLHTCHEHEKEVAAAAFSPNGKFLATADFDGKVCLWDVATGELSTWICPEDGVGQTWRLQFDRRGQHLAAGGTAGVVVWKLIGKPEEPELDSVTSLRGPLVYDLALHPNGHDFVYVTRVAGQDLLYACSLTSNEAPRRINVRPRLQLRALNFDSTGEHLTFVDAKGTLATWNWKANRLDLATTHEAFHVALGPDGRWIATTNAGRGVVILDRQTGQRELSLPPEASDIWSLAWSADGTRLALGLSDGDVVIWDLERVRAELAQFGIAVASTKVAR